MEEKIEVTCPECSKRMNVPVGKHIKFTCPNCNKQLEYGSVSMSGETKKEKVPENIEEEPSLFSSLIIFVLGLLISIPAFILLNKYIPDLDWKFNADRILLFGAILLVIHILLKAFRTLVLIGAVISMIWLAYGSIFGEYGYGGVYRDYNVMISKMNSSPIEISIDKFNLKDFKDKQEVKLAVDSSMIEVKTYVNKIATTTRKMYKTKEEYKTLIQCLHVYKHIVDGWKEVSDPEDIVLYFDAKKTLKSLSGDTEDYAILVASCISSIGGKVRLVKTDDDIYPEIKIGKDSDVDPIYEDVIKKMFESELYGKHFYYHKDDDKSIWIKLGKDSKYPGGDIEGDKVNSVLFI